MQNWWIVGLMGVVGVLCRFGADQLLATWSKDFPFTTLLVNLAGCGLAGAIYALSLSRGLSPHLYAGLLVGFCGGFTTFSAYALQTVTLLEKGRLLQALGYLVVSPVLGLAMAYLPVILLRKWL